MPKVRPKRAYVLYTWFIVSAICLVLLSLTYMSVSNNIGYTILIGLSSIITVIGIMLFETKAHLGMICFGITEILQYISRLLTDFKENNITIELVLGIVVIVTALLLVVKSLIKGKKTISITNIIKENIEPYKIGTIVSLILIAIMVTTSFTMASSYRQSVDSNLSILSMVYVLMPTFILLTTMIPTVMSIYLRIIYYILWIWVVGMASQVSVVSPISLIEPIIYLISVIIGRWNTIKVREGKLKEEALNKKRNNKDSKGDT